MRIALPSAASDFTHSQRLAQTLVVLLSVLMLKIPSPGSHATGWTFKITAHPPEDAMWLPKWLGN